MNFDKLLIYPEAWNVPLQSGGNDFYLIRMSDKCEEAFNV